MHRTTNRLPTSRRRQVYTLDRKMFSWNLYLVHFPFIPHKLILIFGRGKENDVCPQNLRCCEGTISAFEDTTQIESILNHQKQWKRPWKAHSDHHEHCSDKDTTAQAKIINSKPKAKAAAAKAVKKILHKAAHKDGPIHHHSPEEYWGEHADLVKIWRQVLHLLETPEGQAPKIVS